MKFSGQRWWRKRHMLLLFTVLLVASNAVRLQQGAKARPAPHHEIISLPEFREGAFQADREVEMVYQDLRPPGGENVPVIVMLHGSPMRSYDLQGLANRLGRQFRILAPELPGCGSSSQRIADYSLTAHAAYAGALLERLNIPRVHVLAYSQGGGVALALDHLMPDRIASLMMVSSIGVQEFELLGSYHLNHALHGLQWGALGATAMLIPHFGWLDGMMINTAYARNFYDSDLRPLRGYLRAYTGPMLLIHGDADVLVPLGTARETSRLVPQSELRILPGGHLLAFQQPEVVGEEVAGFVRRVERGEAVTAATAARERMEKARQPFDPGVVDQAVGVAMLVMILLIAISTFVSEDLACIGAGLLVTQGVIGYVAAATGAFLGIFVGDLLLFWAGHHWGKAALRRPPLKWMISENAIRESSKWFAQKGPVVVLLSRFVPGSRLPTYFAAGMLHTRFRTFFLFFLVAGLVWAPLLVWLAMKLGQRIMEVLFNYKLYTLAAIATAALLLWMLFKLVLPLFSFKGRRLLFSRWKRITRWEFWPSWLIYPPVLANMIYLGFRYRGFTLFTLANPAIPLGGLVGESKKQILDSLKTRRELLARYELIPAGLDPREKEQIVINFLERQGMSLPVVLKPDAGQRGLGVLVAHNMSEAADYFSVPRPDTLVQEYVPGFEYGVFYYRFPGQPRGHVFSITEKRFPSVIGDGKHNLEHLVLRDPRAVCMAPYFLRKLGDRKYLVPAEEEMVQLVELGNHCRGAVFQDGRWIKTAELERSIDALSRGFEGFYFGRYDLRTPSIDDLREGHGFKVIELNGVTSESTNIYDPGNGLSDALAVLARQWRIAYKIGDRNRRLGLKPATLGELWRGIRDYEASPEA